MGHTDQMNKRVRRADQVPAETISTVRFVAGVMSEMLSTFYDAGDAPPRELAYCALRPRHLLVEDRPAIMHEPRHGTPRP